MKRLTHIHLVRLPTLHAMRVRVAFLMVIMLQLGPGLGAHAAKGLEVVFDHAFAFEALEGGQAEALVRLEVDLVDLLDDLLADDVLLLFQDRLEVAELERLVQEIVFDLAELRVWELLVDNLGIIRLIGYLEKFENAVRIEEALENAFEKLIVDLEEESAGQVIWGLIQGPIHRVGKSMAAWVLLS